MDTQSLADLNQLRAEMNEAFEKAIASTKARNEAIQRLIETGDEFRDGMRIAGMNMMHQQGGYTDDYSIRPTNRLKMRRIIVRDLEFTAKKLKK